MRERRLVRPLTLVIAFVIQFGLASAAMAHHPGITASAACEAGASVIHFTSTSWSPNPLEGENSSIQIYLNGILATTGAYAFPGNSFSGTLPSPLGSSATLHAYAAAAWGDGAAGGQYVATTISLPADCPVIGTGRFTGGGNQVRVGAVKVTRGLTIHCDLLLSNNLEVNWGGDKFHMLEHMETVECSDDPNIIQAPPDAPLDTLIGIGRGRYNNVDGYTIEFTLRDYGEPGTSDRMAIKIYETANPANVILNVPLQVLTGGNLQAHYDQPHK